MTYSVLLAISLAMTSASVAVLSWPIASVIGSGLDIIDRPGARKIHASPTLRTGGILIFLGFMVGVFIAGIHLNRNSQPVLFFASCVFFLGLLEDKFQIRARPRLTLQGGIAYLCILSGGLALKDLGLFALPGYLQVPFTIFAVVGVTNAFNLVDGMNGLCSGLGLASSLSLGALALHSGDFELFRVALIFAGALLGFMVFNLRGKIFMGDAGSYLIGFMISFMSVMLATRNPGISPFAPILIISVPLFDTLFAIYRRIRHGRNPFEADRRHLHHVLKRRYYSGKRAVGVIVILQSSAALSAVLLHENTAVLAGLSVIMTLFLRRLWLRKMNLGPLML